MSDKIRKEAMNLLFALIITIIIFQIIFSKENILTTIRTVLSLFWMLVIPGFYLMYYWHEKLGFTERLIIGTGLSAAITGTASYYLGLLGLHVKYHGIILPLIMLGAAFLLSVKMKNKANNNQQ